MCCAMFGCRFETEESVAELCALAAADQHQLRGSCQRRSAVSALSSGRSQPSHRRGGLLRLEVRRARPPRRVSDRRRTTPAGLVVDASSGTAQRLEGLGTGERRGDRPASGHQEDEALRGGSCVRYTAEYVKQRSVQFLSACVHGGGQLPAVQRAWTEEKTCRCTDDVAAQQR